MTEFPTSFFNEHLYLSDEEERFQRTFWRGHRVQMGLKGLQWIEQKGPGSFIRKVWKALFDGRQNLGRITLMLNEVRKLAETEEQIELYNTFCKSFQKHVLDKHNTR
ncbi:MAG: hypothetical protein KDK65_06535, partial [Chlamydiia bacterium]|nr:hypothetical protein [Chlamydiia bacterium]